MPMPTGKWHHLAECHSAAVKECLFGRRLDLPGWWFLLNQNRRATRGRVLHSPALRLHAELLPARPSGQESHDRLALGPQPGLR